MADLTKQPDKDDKISSEDYAELLNKYQFQTGDITQGRIVSGRVIKSTPTHILVDIGFKTEGAIPVEDFRNPREAAALKPGDPVEAVLERTDPKDGTVVLSKRRADSIKAVEALEKAFTHKSTITGSVKERNRSGYVVDVGIDAFLPESHADIRPIKDPDSLVGQTLPFRILKFDRRSENTVLSRKILLQDEREKKKRQVFSGLSKGQKIKGTVRSLTSFGAFVDIGGIEGLLHVSDLSWGKTGHPSEKLSVGMETEVLVLDFNTKTEKISLGLKQMTPDPWLNILEKYQAGQRMNGRVVSLTDFGAFVELEPGVEGLVHISDLTWSRKLVHPKKILQAGQEVTVTVLDVNAESKRISLGLKQATPHPLDLFQQKSAPGSRIMGKVTSLTDFGAFVEVDKGVEGLVHVSDLSWEKVKHPSEKLKVGDEVEVVVLNIDTDKQKVSLGIKQLEGDIWEDFGARHKTGDIIKVKIVRLADFGVFVEIAPGIEGVVFLSELDDKRIEKPSDAFSVGEEKNAKILKMNPRARKISLSFRQAQFDLQRMEFQKYMDTQDDKMTLGDIMRDQLQNFRRPAKKSRKES